MDFKFHQKQSKQKIAMKNLIKFFPFFLVLFTFWACNSEDDTTISAALEYPSTYRYANVDASNPTTYYEYLETGLNPITVTNKAFLDLDSLLRNDIFSNEEESINPVSEIEFLDNVSVRVNLINMDIEQIVNYGRINDNIIQIQFDEDLDDNIFRYVLSPDNSQLNKYVMSYSYNYFDDFSGERKTRFISSDYPFSTEREDILDESVQKILENGLLQYGDTIMLNISQLVFEKE